MKKIFNKEEVFCSPESFENLSEKELDFYYNQDKENSFALGLILLECGLLESNQDLYDVKKNQLNEKLLKEKENRFKNEYKDYLLLSSTVHQMVQFNSFKRNTIDHLYNKLPNYEQVKSLMIASRIDSQPQRSNFYNPIK